jgi:hypothetical protein
MDQSGRGYIVRGLNKVGQWTSGQALHIDKYSNAAINIQYSKKIPKNPQYSYNSRGM